MTLPNGMEQPRLRFTQDAYAEEAVAEIIRSFQTKGYAVLPNVFERESVDLFAEQLRAAVDHDGIEYRICDDSPLYVWAAQAPRVKQVLVPALTHTAAAGLPSLCNTMWIIQPHDRPDLVPAWHKDREPEGMPGSEYHYPIDVFVGFYFEDLTDDRGPLRAIPGSHWDSSMTPFTEAPQDVVLCRKEDGLLLDQRIWHCGTPRTVPGIRCLAVYAYYLVPVHYGHVPQMPAIQREIWMRQTTRREQAFWGGAFAPPCQRSRHDQRREYRAEVKSSNNNASVAAKDSLDTSLE